MVLFRVSKTGKQPKESIKHTTGNKMVNRCVTACYTSIYFSYFLQ